MSRRERWVAVRDAVLGFGYRRVMKPIVFTRDPESVHEVISHFGMLLGRFGWTQALTRSMFDYQHPRLRTTVAGLEFRNPVGLSAGFDKEGRLLNILPHVGFGFIEIGSVTGTPGPGNPKPRLWRLPKSQALVVHYGLNSSGSKSVGQSLRGRQWPVPVGVSIAKANRPEFDTLDAGRADYVRAAENLRGCGTFRVVNISCPNTSGGEPFTDPEALDQLLSALDPLQSDQPVFIKLPADCPDERIDALVDVARRHTVTGFICTNLTKRRDTVRDRRVPDHGGTSGKIVEARSNEVIARVYRRTKGQMPIIGVGGVFTAEDAYKKIRLGASLVALVTGMIYRGPMVVSEINRGLVRLLERDGLQHLQDAVGLDNTL
jgi:dihydroorotate dehydrogenase